MYSLRGFALLFVVLSVIASSGLAGTYTEDFTGNAFKDAVNTTADWDTAAGELKLPPFVLTLAGSYDTPDNARGVAVDGDVAFVADGLSGLQVFDITDPAIPILIGSYDTPGQAWAVAVDGNLAFVADAFAGLQIIDVTNPAAPTLAGTYFTPDFAYDVAVEGNHAFVATSYAGLQIVDISNPAAPTLAGSYNTPDDAIGVAVAGNHAFVADTFSGLQIIDITNPAAPALAGSYNTPGSADGVAVTGDYALVADGTGGLQVIDISNPAAPSSAGSYAGFAREVAVAGNRAFLAAGAFGLQIIDVTNPAAPTLAGSFATDNAIDVAVDGDHAFVAHFGSGLKLIDTADPVPLTLVGFYGETVGTASGVAVAGDYAYLQDTIFRVIDISNPAEPINVGLIVVGNDGYGKVAVAGGHAYVTGGQSGFFVVDISDPTSPALLGSYDTQGIARGLAVAGDHAYVADGGYGLLVFDISDPTNPTLAGTTGFLSMDARDVEVAGDYAFVADGGSMAVVDISNPASPTIVSSVGFGAFGGSKIALAGDHAFVCKENGLSVVDISNPLSPSVVGFYLASGRECVAVDGDRAFLRGNSNPFEDDFHVVDISDPTSPTLIDTYNLGIGRQIRVAGHNVLVASGASLDVVRVTQSEVYDQENIGQALPIDGADDTIVGRVSSTQTAGVSWELSADGGATFDPFIPDAWSGFSTLGPDLLWRSTHTWTPGINPTVSDVTVEWLNDFAPIAAVTDVPDDQGGQVYMTLTRSGYDFAEELTNPVTQYGIYRRVDAALLSEPSSAAGDWSAGGNKEIAPLPGVESVWIGGTRYVAGSAAAGTFPPGTWALVATVPALQTDSYLVELTTSADSSAGGSGYSAFVVTTHTTIPSLWFVSYVDSGYSVDNIPPGIPTSLMAAYNTGTGNQLSWDPNTEEDFQYYRIYRDTDPNFVPSVGSFVEGTVSTAWTDTEYDGGGVYYKITAVDDADNESDPAAPGAVTSVPESGVPASFALHQNIPNPFNPTTTIRYDVATGGGDVRLQVFDVSGRLVKTLVEDPQSEGRKNVTWDGRNDAGHPVATGTYFYRLSTPGFTQTRKMVLLK